MLFELGLAGSEECKNDDHKEETGEGDEEREECGNGMEPAFSVARMEREEGD